MSKTPDLDSAVFDYTLKHGLSARNQLVELERTVEQLRAAAAERDELKAQLQSANERADLISRIAHANGERARLRDEMLEQCRRTITAQAGMKWATLEEVEELTMKIVSTK